MPVEEETPDHSSLSRIRGRLPLEVHEAMFVFVLKLAAEHQLLAGGWPRRVVAAIGKRELRRRGRQIVRLRPKAIRPRPAGLSVPAELSHAAPHLKLTTQRFRRR
ncbi:MAG TPA: hypothetical protein VGY55_00560 [Pirellulales bacterium]|nr:hypothetical protein [Pirellulales bacterium]